MKKDSESKPVMPLTMRDLLVHKLLEKAILNDYKPQGKLGKGTFSVVS